MNLRTLRAYLLYDQGHIIEAEAELRAAVAGGDDSADLHAMIGLCLLHSGLKDRARHEVEAALQREPNSAFVHYALTYVKEAMLEFMHFPIVGGSPIDGTQSRALVRTGLKAVELEPDNGRYLVRLAEIHQLLGNWRRSLEPAERALALSPGDVQAGVLRAEALARLRRSEEARFTLARALELNPEAAAAHTGMGWAWLRAGDHERALVFFNEALRMAANLEWAHEGALECAKHRYRIYRGIFRLKTWFAAQHMVMRVLLGIAGVVAVCLLFVGFLELIDPFVRARLGNKGTGLLLTLMMFGLLLPVMFHEYIFLWLIRRQTAAKTSTGEQRFGFARFHIATILIGLAGAAVMIAMRDVSKDWMAAVLGLVPGGYLLWLTAKQLPVNVSKTGWTIYSALVFISGPVVGVLFQEAIRHWHRGFLLLLLCAPILPLGIAIELYKKKEMGRKHDDALAAIKRNNESDSPK